MTEHKLLFLDWMKLQGTCNVYGGLPSPNWKFIMAFIAIVTQSCKLKNTPFGAKQMMQWIDYVTLKPKFGVREIVILLFLSDQSCCCVSIDFSV